jgi:23S rRNA pseudouridine1911/1915/1917 synthase
MSHVSYDGKKALTYYEVIAYYKDCALVRVRIVTGRTHQIRVHFAANGHGLIGDDTYGYQSKLINRPALHAWKLGFEFKGKKFSYHKIVPQDFNKLLNSLKNKSL